MTVLQKIRPFLTFDGQAEAAATFYASIFQNSRIDSVLRSPVDLPSGVVGEVLMVEFTLAGTPFVALNTPGFTFTEAVSFSVLVRIKLRRIGCGSC